MTPARTPSSTASRSTATSSSPSCEPALRTRPAATGHSACVRACSNWHGSSRATLPARVSPRAAALTARPAPLPPPPPRLHFFPPPASGVEGYSNKPELLKAAAALPLEPALVAAGAEVRDAKAGDVKMIYCTAVGDGPRTLGPSEALLDPLTGFPLEAKLQKWQQTLAPDAGGGCPVKPSFSTYAAVAVAAIGFLLVLKKSN